MSTNTSSADYGRFDELAEEFAARFRRGERPSLQEYIDRCPELADEIRELFPALVEVERVDDDQQVHPGAAEAAVTLPTLGLVGDYRILREVGRGGMGVVYEAEQVSLGRRVALKVLPRQVSHDHMTLARFRREARSAAQLHHTNIVPVFEVGKDGEVSYYAMQFIQGQGLDQVITELRRLKDRAHPTGPARQPELPDAPIPSGPTAPAPSRACQVSRMAQSLLTGRLVPDPPGGPSEAEAASTNGKATAALTDRRDPEETEAPRASDAAPVAVSSLPSSVVLPGGSQLSAVESGRQSFFRSVAHIGRQVAAGLAYAHARGIVHRDIKPSNLLLDTEGVVWITDFGLAKASDDGLTQTGDIIGTLRYMAPERFRGEGDGRADVYALGLTLYELLTLRPAFDSSDRLKLIEQIKTVNPPRPRAIDPRIPRDLETIVHKAVDKDPKGRYQSADALAEDLRRFLAGEPILARRTDSVERAWRWCRRNPALASLCASLIVVLLTGTAIASYYAVRAREGERLALDNAVKADRERGLAVATAEVLQRRDYIGRVNLALSECLGNNVSRALELLDGCPKELRGWEWDYAWRKCHLDLGTFRQSGQTLNGVAFSPDGTRVASVSGAYAEDEPAKKGDLVVRDVATGQEIFSHPDVPSGFRGVAFSPDGRWIATGNASDVVIWNAATGNEEFRLQDPDSRDFPLLSLAYSRDGRRIIAGHGLFNRSFVGGHANLWDLTSLKHERVGGNHGTVYSVAFSPDGREVALGSYGLVELLDLNTTPTQIRPIPCHSGTAYAVAFSPDGQYLASGGFDRALRLWDRATGKEIRAFYGHEGFVRGLSFSPDSQWLLSASEDYSLKLWEVASGRSLADFHGHQFFASCVAYSPDGRLVASGGQDHAVRLWSATRRAPVTFTGHDRAVFGLEFLPKSQRLVSGAGLSGTRVPLKLWDATTGDPLEPSFERCPWVRAVAVRPDGRRLATAHSDEITGAGTVRVWDPDTGRPVWQREAQVAGVVDVAYSPDGRWLASAGMDQPDDKKVGGAVRLWDAESGRAIHDFEKHAAGVHGVAFSPDSRWLASGWSDGMVRIWDTKDPAREARELPGHAGQVERVVFLPDGRLATAGGTTPISATSGLGEVKIWDLSTGRVLNLRGHTGLVKGLACSPDGRRLATGSDDRTIKLWDTTTGEEVFTLRGHTAGVLCVAFSPDGRRIASGGYDRTVRVWDTSQPTAGALLTREAESRARPPELPQKPFGP